MKTKEQKSRSFDKLVKTIYTCKTSDHVASTRKMITNYFTLFNQEYPDVKYDVMVLNEELDKKKSELHIND